MLISEFDLRVFLKSHIQFVRLLWGVVLFFFMENMFNVHKWTKVYLIATSGIFSIYNN